MRNFKLLLLTGVVISASLFIYSCSKEDVKSSQNRLVDNTKSELRAKEIVKIKITCTGSCDCYINGRANSDGSGHVAECSCDDCEMGVTLVYADKVINHSLLNAKYDVNFLDEFMFHMSTNYPNENYEITTIEIDDFEQGSSELYIYNVNGSEETIMFASNKDKKYKISCDGTCGCRERFIYGDPPSSECTCNDCTMTVTEVM